LSAAAAVDDCLKGEEKSGRGVSKKKRQKDWRLTTDLLMTMRRD
jgi:hypothetical protein